MPWIRQELQSNYKGLWIEQAHKLNLSRASWNEKQATIHLMKSIIILDDVISGPYISQLSP